MCVVRLPVCVVVGLCVWWCAACAFGLCIGVVVWCVGVFQCVVDGLIPSLLVRSCACSVVWWFACVFGCVCVCVWLFGCLVVGVFGCLCVCVCACVCVCLVVCLCV